MRTRRRLPPIVALALAPLMFVPNLGDIGSAVGAEPAATAGSGGAASTVGTAGAVGTADAPTCGPTGLAPGAARTAAGRGGPVPASSTRHAPPPRPLTGLLHRAGAGTNSGTANPGTGTANTTGEVRAPTPRRMAPGRSYRVPVTVTNTTHSTWAAGSRPLTYHWSRADGSRLTGSPRGESARLQSDLAPGGSTTLPVRVRAPAAGSAAAGDGGARLLLQWEVAPDGLAAKLRLEVLRQQVTLDVGLSLLGDRRPTSDQLGLEAFYQYSGTATGAGSNLLVNQATGNPVFSYNPFSNPSRGLATFVRLTHNGMDSSDSVAGPGWSVATSTLQRLGSPLRFRGLLSSLLGHPAEVILTDGDGTSHTFALNRNDSHDPRDWTYDSPPGVNLYLQRTGDHDPDRAWVMTRPDRTKMYFDRQGYQTASVDRNGNELRFTYERGLLGGRNTGLLTAITDDTGRRTLTLDYYRPGDEAPLFVGGVEKLVANLTDLDVVGHLRSITDANGRTVSFAYSDHGQLREVTDGAGGPQPKVFQFFYDDPALLGSGKLTRVVDPNGNDTQVRYADDDTGAGGGIGHWGDRGRVGEVVDRRGGRTGFGYADPDGPDGPRQGSQVTDPNGHQTSYVLDRQSRPVRMTNAKGEVTRLHWDGDNNVDRLTEDNGATTTWRYDQLTGYPREIRDAEANAHGYPATRLTYRTELDGHVADLTGRVTPEGRRWLFGYDGTGNLISVTDPKGTATAAENDYTARYAYDEYGQLTKVTDANGNSTEYGDYDVNGYPRRITDPFGCSSFVGYDAVGDVVSSTDAKGRTSTFTYDVFKRPLGQRIPKDAAAGDYVATPGPRYDANDNILAITAANGAQTTARYDAADQVTAITAPKDRPTDPDRVSTFAYDPVGNLLSETAPKGTLTTGDPDDFTTTYTYDPVNQLRVITDAAGQRSTATYDDAGNLVRIVDPRKNATADPNDFTTRYGYDLDHRPTTTTDAAGSTTAVAYDRDGNQVATTDEEGNKTLITLDERALPVETRVPHAGDGGKVTYRTTRYRYDQVGNRTATVSPRGVATPDDPDDFTTKVVYDAMNRVAAHILPYDKDDSQVDEPDRTTYRYDRVGDMVEVSAPPSGRQTVRNVTRYSYFDNHWTRSSTDPFGIKTTYGYDDLGQQTRRRLTSAGGSTSRTMHWSYYPDGQLATRSDDGVPVGSSEVVVDNSDRTATRSKGAWPTSRSGARDHQGFDYQTNEPGGDGDSFTWNALVPRSGEYEVFVRYPHGASASKASYTVEHRGGSTTKTVDQTQQAGSWVSLGSYRYRGNDRPAVTLAGDSNGVVAADAVKLVRDNSADIDNEQKTFTHRYDPNGNLVSLTDSSSGAAIDEYAVAYDGLDRAVTVRELADGAVKETTRHTYDPNGNVLSTRRGDQSATYTYDARDLVSKVTHNKTAAGDKPKVTTFGYTDRGDLEHLVKGNKNTVDFTYYADGLLKHQIEKKSGGGLVSEHSLTYDADSNRTKDVARTENADTHAIDKTTSAYTYDPRDRVRKVTKTGHDDGTETYAYDASNNVVRQAIAGTTTTSAYDRNRLTSATSAGTTTTYDYDPFGRLDSTSTAGKLSAKYVYDGFDRTAEYQAHGGGEVKRTKYAYDPLDRTVSRTTDAGADDAKTTSLHYIGLSDLVSSEEVDGKLTKSYQYTQAGELLSQESFDKDGKSKDSYYGFNAHSDVENVTGENGDASSTYGYTAYGQDDQGAFSGIDKPDPGKPDQQPFNVYRYNTKRWDSASGTYDMGFRDYDPGLNRFLSLDLFNGALADLGMTVDPFTNNRYAFGAGNPISSIELDGHGWLSDLGHAALDVAGLVPGVGEVADLANAAWYAGEGDYVNAALSAASAIPFAGYAATAVKAGKYAKRGYDAATGARKGVKAVSEAVDTGATAARKVDVPTAKRPGTSGASKAAPSKAGPPEAKPPPKPAAKPAEPPPSPKTRDPIFADNDLLVNATRGHQGALAEIRAGKTYVTPNQFREFLAGGAGRRQFLQNEGVELFGGSRAGQAASGSAFQRAFGRVNPAQGRGDAALCAFACATGYEAVTMEKRLTNFVTKTLQAPDIPIRRVLP